MAMNKNALVVSIALLVGLSLSCSSLPHVSDTSRPASRTAGEQIPSDTIQLGSQPPISETESNRIKMLIQGLATIDKPTFGINGTLSGSAFSPIDSAYQVNSGLIMNHGFGTNSEFVELVKLGPKALPFLLQALDDKTPTKLVINNGVSFFGDMRFEHELAGNRANTNEQEILNWPFERESLRPDHRETLTNYTVTIGDACFVAIGQIVGRPYQAVRYQPTAMIVINTPTHDDLLAKQVRAIWQSMNSAQHLLDSLLLDYAGGKNSDRRGFGDGAAMRLLYYFPQQTTNLIVQRLRSLGESKSDETSDFIRSLTFCQEPSIRDELRRIFESTTNVDMLCATVPAMDGSRRRSARLRLERFLDQVPKQEEGYYDDGNKLLLALGKNFGEDAKPAFQRYLKEATVQRVITMTEVLERTQGIWSVELLAPYLSDTRKVGRWTYPSFPKEGEKQRQVRVCDAAASTIAFNFRRLPFELKGDHKDLDAQIAVMRQKISAGDFK